MRRREPWPLFCGDDAFAEAWLCAEIANCRDPVEQASLVQLLSRLGAWAAVERELNQRPELLAHADGRAALLGLRQATDHPNPWLSLLTIGQESAFLEFCETLTRGHQLVEVQLSGGLGDQLEALALLTPLQQEGPLAGRIRLRIPIGSAPALRPLLAQANPDLPLPPHRWWSASSEPASGHAWLDLIPMRALVASQRLERCPVPLFQHLAKRERQPTLVVCWRSKVDLRERLWAHLRSLQLADIEELYTWLIPWAGARGWRVADITLYPPRDAAKLTTRFGASTTLDLAHPRLNSLADTAALVAQARLVLTVDTALIHLAHAIGLPRWLLLHAHPDPRWRNRLLQDGPDRGALQVFQQDVQGQWQKPLHGLRMALEALET